MSAHSHRSEGRRIPKDRTVTPLRPDVRIPCDALETSTCITAEMLTLASSKNSAAVLYKADALPGAPGSASDASANNSHVAAESYMS